MSNFLSIDTVTFVTVCLVLFVLYNAAVWLWFRYHSGSSSVQDDKDKEINEKFSETEYEDLPF
ncbi:MAG: hypothetical protein MJ003_06195 [Paludibacteraceae bacterium]|nr:hypothetical protein [Paludibacteraceae bacterium]